MYSSISSNYLGAKSVVRHGIESFPKQQRRPLPTLLSSSSSMMQTAKSVVHSLQGPHTTRSTPSRRWRTRWTPHPVTWCPRPWRPWSRPGPTYRPWRSGATRKAEEVGAEEAAWTPAPAPPPFDSSSRLRQSGRHFRIAKNRIFILFDHNGMMKYLLHNNKNITKVREKMHNMYNKLGKQKMHCFRLRPNRSDLLICIWKLFKKNLIWWNPDRCHSLTSKCPLSRQAL